MACSERLESYKPPHTVLKSSLRNRVKEYPRVAALHGIAYVADSTRPKAERFGWFLCIVASTVATLGIIFTLMKRFQTDPMMNSLDLRFGDAPLKIPQFYICPPWRSFKTIPPPKQYDHTFYHRLYNWNFGKSSENVTYPNSLDSIVSLKKLFMQNAPSYDQFISKSVLISHRETPLNRSFYQLAVTTAGICFILPSLGHILHEGAVRFIFNTTMFPTSVYAMLEKDTGLLRHHQSYYFPFPASVTTALQETYTSPEAELFARSQRQCFFPGEQSPYVTCVLDCKIANSLKICNCVPWYLAKDGIKECQISRYECLDKNSAKIADTSKCQCRQSCDNIVLKNTELQIQSPNESCVITLRARSLLTYKRTVRFGWSDLFVSFGGIAGFFLGCSLLSIIEFGYYFSLRTYCGAVLSLPKRRHNIVKINVLDAAHPVNLTRDRKRPALSKKGITIYDYAN